MKTFLVSLLCASGLAVSTVHAGENTARDVLIGGVAGAIIGENNHHQAVEGALIGAAAGLIWNAATDRDYSERRVEYREPCREEYREPCRESRREVVVVAPVYGHREYRHPRRVVYNDYYSNSYPVCRSNVVVETRVVVREPARVVNRYDDHPAVNHRKVICIREPGCAPRYVEVLE